VAGTRGYQMNIVILTGAGISAESGLGTFRDKDGLWTRYRIEDMATPEAHARKAKIASGNQSVSGKLEGLIEFYII
jgi:NAD-dependent SIR2 family protein deacetylase